MLLIACGLLLGAADFARWDNLELFLPCLLSAHRRILQGDLPLWNPLQNLGEPLHAMGIAGVLYPPYTIATALVDAARWNPRSLMSVIVILHAGFAGLGLHLLCRSFGVRPLLAFVAAVSGAMCGFAIDVGAVWIPVMPNLAWCAWSLWGAKEMVDAPRPRGVLALTSLALAMPFHTGHVQPAVYNLLVTGAFAAAYAVVRGRLRTRIVALGTAAGAAVLLGMPSVLPTASILADTERIQSFTPELFGERGMAPGTLLGLTLPVFPGDPGYLEPGSLATAHVGAWLVPALLAGLWLVLVKRRAGASSLLLVSAFAAIVILFTLGNHTPFYGLTYGIPLWSSFRWPFRLFLHAVPLLVAAGAMSLELLAQESTDRLRTIGTAAFGALVLVVWLAIPHPMTVPAVVSAAAGVAAMGLVGWLDRPAARAALAVVAVVGAGALFFFTHSPGRYKAYPGERPGALDPRVLGIAADSRLLPLSPSIPPGARLQELGLFHSATLNGYASLTGQRFAMTSVRLRDLLPTDDAGLLPREITPLFLNSHLMCVFGARYVLVASDDRQMNAILDSLTSYTVHAATSHARLFENPCALPPLFFATEVRAFTPSALVGGLVSNQAPATTAYIVDPGLTEGMRPAARVERIEPGNDRVRADVSAPDGGLLIASMNYSPDWIARIDGVRRPTRIADGTLIGVDVPAGARRVELVYDPPSLRCGLWLALLGVGLLGLATFLTRERRT
jgi:hypothetical protein